MPPDSKTKTIIKFTDGSSGGLVNRYFVHPYKDKYLKMDCVIYENGERIALPLSSKCETCSRDFSKIRNKKRFLCVESFINKRLGHVARICVDCRWFYEREKGIALPKTIEQFIADGFRPHLL